ncbi:hypothetical protein D7027_04895 [Ochrobactrum intermedium]|nr:hypothetical protein [Brucella intermedia]
MLAGRSIAARPPGQGYRNIGRPRGSARSNASRTDGRALACPVRNALAAVPHLALRDAACGGSSG